MKESIELYDSLVSYFSVNGYHKLYLLAKGLKRLPKFEKNFNKEWFEKEIINPYREVLKKYSVEKGVDDSRWNLVTGNKKDIYYLARKSYLAVKTGKPEELYDMVHTENFILVDKNKRIRGFYDGTNLDQPTNDPKTKNMKQLLEDILWLCENQ